MTIDFKNPYNTEIQFSTYIEGDEKSVFSLLGIKNTNFCKGNATY